MPNDHISIPKLIQRNFSTNGLLPNYNVIEHKLTRKSIKTLGTSTGYYTKEVEKKILNLKESNFANVMHELIIAKKPDIILKIFNKNKQVILDFINLMYFRVPKSLDDVNKNSLTAKFLGPFSHSELIKVANERNISILSFVGKNPTIYPVINRTNLPFLNNSIGFSFILEKDKKMALFFPLSPSFGIYLTDDKKLDYPFYRIDSEIVLQRFNNFICETEAGFGLGYIFTITGFDLLPYLSKFEQSYKNINLS